MLFMREPSFLSFLPVLRLPPEVLLKILSHLDPHSLICISHVNKLFHQLANDEWVAPTQPPGCHTPWSSCVQMLAHSTSLLIFQVSLFQLFFLWQLFLLVLWLPAFVTQISLLKTSHSADKSVTFVFKSVWKTQIAFEVIHLVLILVVAAWSGVIWTLLSCSLNITVGDTLETADYYFRGPWLWGQRSVPFKYREKYTCRN